MSMVVRTNTMAMNALRNLNTNNSQVSKSLQKLSSGYKINSAADDASGLAISEKMKSQIAGLDQASSNAQDGISLVQTAEGATTQIHSMLNRMVELATKSANGTIQDDVDRDAIQSEVDSLNSEITRISSSTKFNGINLLDGSLGGGSTSSTATTFTGSEVAKVTAAVLTSDTLNTTNLSDINTASAAVDVMSIDGQKVTIDWTDSSNAALLSELDQNFSAATMTTAQGQDIASKLQDTINNAITSQGATGSVTVSFDGSKLSITSDNKGYGSEVSYLGSTNADGTALTTAANAQYSVMNNLVDQDATALATSTNVAGTTYNGSAIDATAGNTFQMTINGTTVQVTSADIAKGDTMTATAGTVAGTATASTGSTGLTKAVQDAVVAYNTQMGLTGGVKDDASGLTGLSVSDFAVTTGDNGNFVVKYSGKEDINFSFSNIGDTTTASDLGLTGGSSKAGGNQGLSLQIGDSGDTYNKVTVSIDDLSAKGIGTDNIDVSTQSAAASAIETINTAINQVSTNRANLGALQNRLEYTIDNLDNTSENISSANSAIRDTDMASEMMKYTQSNTLLQAAQSMLAQANSAPQAVLQLLQG